MTKSPAYQLILESEVLTGKPISRSVIQLVQQYASEQSLQIFVPELSIEEVKKAYVDAIAKEQKQYNDASVRLSVLLHQSVAGVEMNEEQIGSHIDSLLKQYGITKLVTNYQHISIDQLVHKSIHSIVPFDHQKEKGFRNAILTETILQHLPSMVKHAPVACVCPDDMLRQYLISQTTHIEEFLLCSSLPEFESFFRLRKPGEEVNVRAQMEATRQYWISFIHARHVADMIRGQLQHDGTRGDVHVPHTVGLYTADPVFIERQKQPYIWSSTILCQHVSWGYTQVVQQMTEYTVRWWTWMDKQGRIEKAEVIDISKSAEYILDPLQSMQSRHLRTTSGQSVVEII